MSIERAHKTQRRPDWFEVNVDIMRELLEAKLVQNDDVQIILTKTGTKTIVENSPWDSFWGCGPDGTGKNLVGRLWMELRGQNPGLKPFNR